jgi:hypothetical protein
MTRHARPSSASRSLSSNVVGVWCLTTMPLSVHDWSTSCSGHIGAAPTSKTVKASDDEHFGAHSRSCRVGEEVAPLAPHRPGRARFAHPSGSLRKVSAHTIILLSCPADATSIAAVLTRSSGTAPKGHKLTWHEQNLPALG